MKHVAKSHAFEDLGSAVATGILAAPDIPIAVEDIEVAKVPAQYPYLNVSPTAADTLVQTVFGGVQHRVPRIRYATAYKLAEGKAGGDIVDIFHYDNDHVSLAVADIAGKGIRAAVHAAMIKYGLRSFISNGLTPENVMRSLDRLYLENNAFEQVDSFACVFLGVIDATRRLLHYTNAAMETVLVLHADGSAVQLAPTAPLVGVFEDQHHLFKQSFIPLHEGSLIVVATDGVSESRDHKGTMLGVDRISEIVRRAFTDSEPSIAAALLAEAECFSDDIRRDDIAILVVRVL